MRILLIEKNLNTARRLAELLELDGHKVAVATTAAEAFGEAPVFRPELVVSDFDLSGQMEGFAVCGIITTSLAIIPVVLVTDRQLEKAVLACRDLCPLAVVRKPVEYEELSRLIADFRIH